MGDGPRWLTKLLVRVVADGGAWSFGVVIGKRCSAVPGFASTEDLTEKKVSFDQIGAGLYAYTAEGDPELRHHRR